MATNAPQIPEEFYDILPDILGKIITSEGVYASLKLVSRRFNVIARNLYKSINAPTTCGLYPRQLAAFNWMKKNSRSNMEIIADVSFGKTYLALKYIEWKTIADRRPVLVLVPPGIQNVWKTEVVKHMPGWHARLLSTRKFITNDDFRKLLRKAKANNENETQLSAGILTGRILACTSRDQLHILERVEFQLCVCDEMHRNLNALERLVDREQVKKNIVLIGANDANIDFGQEIYKGSAEHLMIRPAVTYHFIDDVPTMDQLLARPTKHKVLINSTERKFTDPHTYNFDRHLDSVYRKYVEHGGVLYGSARCMAESVNINHCSEMFIDVPENFTLKRLRQLIGRVCRQSALYSNVDIYLCSDDPGQTIRARLCGANFSGYDIRGDYRIIYKNLTRRGISVGSLTHADLFVLFMTRCQESDEARRNEIPPIFNLDIQTVFELLQ